MNGGETTWQQLEANARAKNKPGIASCEAMPGFFFGSTNLRRMAA
jgi:hypothetical protein